MRRPFLRVSLLTVAVVLVPFIAYVQPTQAAPTPSGDDTPVLLTPKGEHDNGEDETGFDKLRDAYYWSRLLSGDDGGLTMDQAATLRAKASTQASGIAADTQRGAARGGTWASVGPDPIVQVGRTSNTFEAVSGRIGALAVRKDGTIILGAAQGGVWTYSADDRHVDLAHARRRHAVGRRARYCAQQRQRRVHGLGRGRVVGRQLLR